MVNFSAAELDDMRLSAAFPAITIASKMKYSELLTQP